MEPLEGQGSSLSHGAPSRTPCLAAKAVSLNLGWRDQVGMQTGQLSASYAGWSWQGPSVVKIGSTLPPGAQQPAPGWAPHGQLTGPGDPEHLVDRTTSRECNIRHPPSVNRWPGNVVCRARKPSDQSARRKSEPEPDLMASHANTSTSNQHVEQAWGARGTAPNIFH